MSPPWAFIEVPMITWIQVIIVMKRNQSDGGYDSNFSEGKFEILRTDF